MATHPQPGYMAADHALQQLDPASDAAKAMSWLMLQNEELTLRVIELDDEAEQSRTARDRSELALLLIRDAMRMLGVIADREVRVDKEELFARDFAPFINIMAFHGMKLDGTAVAKPRKRGGK